MNKIISIILSIFAINIYSQEIETENWKTDINFLKTELQKKHKNLFFKLTKNEFENGIEKIINNLDKDSDIETSIKLHQLIAKIGDSHTTLSTSQITSRRKILPVDFMWFKEGLFISGTSKENYELLDKKLISINGFKTDKIIDSLKTLNVTENNALVNINSARNIESNVLLKHFGFSKPNDSIYELELSNLKGEISTYKLKEILNDIKYSREKTFIKINSERPFYRNGTGKSFKSEYFANEKIYFIQYNKCIRKKLLKNLAIKKMLINKNHSKSLKKKSCWHLKITKLIN